MIHPATYVYSFGGLYAGCHLFYSGFKDLKLERLIAGTAVSKVRSVALGAVELAGVARPSSELVRDPIYEFPCAYYHVTVREERGSGKNSHWVTIYDNASAQPFYLEDETGRILVYPEGAELYLEKAVDVRVGGLSFSSGADLDNQVEAFAAAAPGSGGPRQLTAYIVREKQDLCVLGCAAPDRAAEQGPTWEEAVRALKADPERMKALDQDGDGALSPEEWDQGVKELRERWEAARSAAAPPPIVVRKEGDAPLVISDKPRGKLAGDLEWHSALKIFGGPALALACGAYIARMF